MATLQKMSMVQRWATAVDRLPDPPETWRVQDVDLDRSTWSKLYNAGLIEVVKRRPQWGHDWRVKPDVHEMVEEYLAGYDQFECCGGRGVINTGDGLECKNCGASVSETEFLKVTA